jgi:hypothetical protein
LKKSTSSTLTSVSLLITSANVWMIFTRSADESFRDALERYFASGT